MHGTAAHGARDRDGRRLESRRRGADGHFASAAPVPAPKDTTARLAKHLPACTTLLTFALRTVVLGAVGVVDLSSLGFDPPLVPIGDFDTAPSHAELGGFTWTAVRPSNRSNSATGPTTNATPPR